MRSVVAIAACVLSIVAPSSRAEAQTSRPGQGWSDEKALSGGPGPVDVAYNFSRAIATDNADGVHVVWYERRDGKECACYRRSADAGKTWEESVVLADASEPMPHDLVLPVVAVDGNDVYAAWHEKNSKQGMNVFLKHSGDGGKTWGPAAPVWKRRGSATHASLAAAGGFVHVAWGDHRDGDETEIYYARSTDHGKTWGQEERLTEQPFDSWVPSLAANGQDVVLAWVDTRDGNEEEYVRASHDGGRTWGPQSRLTDHAAKSWAPSVVVNGATIHVAWFDQKHAPAQPEEAEKIIDEAMTLVGLPAEPAPTGIRVPQPEEAAKRRATEKLKQIHAASREYVQGGGDADRLQAIMHEFQDMAKPVGLPEADRRLDEALKLIGVEPEKAELPADERGWQQRFQGKMKLIQGKGPAWVRNGGDERRLRSALEAFERQVHDVGSASYAEKERKLDEALRLMGLTYRPGPAGDVSTIYFTEAFPSRVRDKMRRVQAAAPEFAKRSGDTDKLKGLLHDFERKMKVASTEWDVYYRSSHDGGRSWGPEVRLTDAPGVSHRPSLVADGDSLYVAWWDGRDGNNEIYLKHSADGGRTWGADTRLTTSPGDSTKPSLAVSREFLHLIWLDSHDGRPRLSYRRAPRAAVDREK